MRRERRRRGEERRRDHQTRIEKETGRGENTNLGGERWGETDLETVFHHSKVEKVLVS